jgi:hypothetical protein
MGDLRDETRTVAKYEIFLLKTDTKTVGLMCYLTTWMLWFQMIRSRVNDKSDRM